MKKIILIAILVNFILTNFAYSAAGDGAGSSKVKNNYDKASYLIKRAKKLEKKGKIEKAQKRYEKALKYLIKSNDSLRSVESASWVSRKLILPMEAVEDGAGELITMRTAELPQFLKR